MEFTILLELLGWAAMAVLAYKLLAPRKSETKVQVITGDELEKWASKNQHLLKGIPLLTVEEITDSQGVNYILAYEELSGDYVTQATSVDDLVAKITAIWPHDSVFARETGTEEYVQLK
jgi:hypothetical protein